MIGARIYLVIIPRNFLRSAGRAPTREDQSKLFSIISWS